MKFPLKNCKPAGSPIKTPTNKLAMAITLALATPIAGAATFNVTETTDDGTGLVNNSLSWAILQANTTPGADVIELNTDVNLIGVMKRLIDSDVTVTSDGNTRTINGNNQFRPLFVKSGTVTIEQLVLEDSVAEGGNGRGHGAGLGGAVFVYDGQVTINEVSITNSRAQGGSSSAGYGGGGMFGNASRSGGGLFANAINNTGGYGGYGNYQGIDFAFGTGGSYSTNGIAGNGGFGAGAGGSQNGTGGDGGFGGGGGYSYYGTVGNGGFGAGSGGENGYYSAGLPGFGGNRHLAAGLGGGIFVRSGNVALTDVVFDGNQAQQSSFGQTSSEGLGGGIFVLHTLSNPNGNNQGMPASLPTVTGCGVVFTNNSADTDTGASNNNDDVFDLSNLITPDNGLSITDPCFIPNQEILVTGNAIEITDGDTIPSNDDFTYLGATTVGGQDVSRTFSITNQGNMPLNLTGNPVVELQNNAGQFSVTAQPVSSTLNYTDEVSFEVTFSPVVAGQDTATVTIQNNDTDEDPYDFVIAAEGFAFGTIFNVTQTTDDGTGLVDNSLSWAILQANTSPGTDNIILNTDVTLTGVMKRLVDSNLNIFSDAQRRTIDGNNQFRPLFIKSGQVNIQNIDLQNGRAEGGDSGDGGKGAGLGGTIFLYDGELSLSDVTISGSTATGGFIGGGSGGGGMYGIASSGGGGLFANATSGTGGYGGYGNYNSTEPDFARGGSYDYNQGGNGGFGGGGGYSYNDSGNGGFGGGGAYGYNSNGGSGGFGAGGGLSYFNNPGQPGFGGSGEFSAGFGGALFVRAGHLSLENTTFTGNNATSTGGGEGFGGALFVQHITTQSNGNNQGMPSTLPSVSGCGVVFNNNTADTDPNTTNNNDDVFDLADRIAPDNGLAITDSCGSTAAEIWVAGNSIEIPDGDNSPDSNDFTAMGSAQIQGQTIVRTFTITNQGETPLNLTGNPVVELQNNSGQFSISTQPPATTIGFNESVTFDVSFSPTVEGLDSATVVIQNDDADEAPYDFLIEAEGIAQAPILQVLGNGTEILNADETPDPADNTDFGFTPVTGGMLEKTFEIKNLGYAPLNLANVQLFQFNNDFSITENITDTSLDHEESTFVTVQLDPANAGSSAFTAFEVYDENFNFLHYHAIAGYGQPALTINSNINYIQEGGTAEFTVSTDVLPTESLDFTWQVTGQVNSQDFPGSVPSGSGTVSAQSNSFSIQFATLQDGVYEGPELFTVVLTATDPRLALGFPSVSGGVIDDDLIFVDGFNPASLKQVLTAMAKFDVGGDGLPSCDVESCQFLNRSLDLSPDRSWSARELVAWFEETLILMQPRGDWDGDGLPNHHDLNPFGLPFKLTKP